MAAPQTPEDCRRQAEECEQRAAKMTDPYSRTTMLFVARRWRELADEGDASQARGTKPQADPPASTQGERPDAIKPRP